MDTNAPFFLNRCRRLAAAAAAIFAISFAGDASAEGTLRREATVESVTVENGVNSAEFVIEEKTKETNAKPVKWHLAVEEGNVYQQLASGRKVHVKFSALKPGQHVRVTALTPFGITGYNLAKEVVILPATARK